MIEVAHRRELVHTKETWMGGGSERDGGGGPGGIRLCSKVLVRARMRTGRLGVSQGLGQRGDAAGDCASGISGWQVAVIAGEAECRVAGTDRVRRADRHGCRSQAVNILFELQ